MNCEYEIANLLPLAEVRYQVDSNIRFYHNLNHAIAVMDAVLEIEPNASTKLQVAALYHDAVYIPGAKGDANEWCSAAALAIDWREGHLEVEDVTLPAAQELIIKTSIPHHLTPWRVRGDHAVLLDADLRSLSADWGQFLATQSSIIKENGSKVSVEALRKCGEFLLQFLKAREFIYHTEYARTHWEATARNNIHRLINSPQAFD
jgi:predicted metal-dependent HD superfamily phosphohydrolase